MSTNTKPALRKTSSRRARRLCIGSERPGLSVCLADDGSWHLVLRDGAGKVHRAYLLSDEGPGAWSLCAALPVLVARGASARSLTDAIDATLDNATEPSMLCDAVEGALLDRVALAPAECLARPHADVWVAPAEVAWRLDARFTAPRHRGVELACDHLPAPGGGHHSVTVYGRGGRRVAPWIALGDPLVVARFVEPLLGLDAGVPPLTLGRAVASSLAADDPVSCLRSILEVIRV